MNPVEWPLRDQAILNALQEAWQDGSWGCYAGRYTELLTQQLATFHQVPHVRLCSSGTIGVELALRGLGVQPQDEVLLGGYDFPGNFRAIERIGARPVLVDLDRTTLAVDLRQLDAASSDNTKALIVSHLHSGMAPMREIIEWAVERRIRVVEDACQAPAAMIDGRRAGTWGDIGVLSFGGSKLVTAGRGGALLIQRGDDYQRIAIYAEQGNDAFPLSELQAMVISPQWERIDERNAKRRASVQQLVGALAEVDAFEFAGVIGRLDGPSYYKVAWWWNTGGVHAWSRDQLCAALQMRGVPIDAGFRGFTKRSSRRCRVHGNLGVAAMASEKLILLHHPALLQPPETITHIANAIKLVVLK